MTTFVLKTWPKIDWEKLGGDIERLALRAGLAWTQVDASNCQITAGPHVIVTLPKQYLHKRLMSELIDLAGSRICFGFNEHPFYTLNALTEKVLRRAVLQGLSERYSCD